MIVNYTKKYNNIYVVYLADLEELNKSHLNFIAKELPQIFLF